MFPPQRFTQRTGEEQGLGRGLQRTPTNRQDNKNGQDQYKKTTETETTKTTQTKTGRTITK